ncbi:hypothetical protein [Sorangium sp. So ce117]|jgi:hypothetical protein|uniref:hypothetical protein n=1 Tax=Sorangium sp. So ce117 TaxID=3133277 RepID=UPI003F5DFB55
MSNRRNLQNWFGMALVTGLVGVTGSACVGSMDPSVDSEATGESEEAIVTGFAVGTALDCTMSGATPTGRRWAYLIVGNDQSTCFRTPNVNRTDLAPATAIHCHALGRSIGCDFIRDL